MRTTIALAVGVLMTGGIFAAGLGPPAPDSFYVDDELYATIGTPTELPNKGPTDGLFVFTGLRGQTPVAEAKPGDRDYNGGRWQVTVLEFTESGIAAHDADDDGYVDFQLTNWEQVVSHIEDLGHLRIVGPGPRFVCPVIEQH